MRAAILYFSPCGNTRKVAEMIQRGLESSDWTVQLLDLTRRESLFPRDDWATFLSLVEPHDLLLIGGPIYIDHLHYNLLRLIEELPLPDGKTYSPLGALFTTFGKITPGVGVAEASLALGKRGRRTLAALDVDGEHCISRHIPYPIGTGLPGKEVLPLIEELVATLTEAVTPGVPTEEDLTPILVERYLDFPHLADEREVIEQSFPKVSFDLTACGQCLECVENCPVNFLVVKDGYPATGEVDRCIHCTQCLHVCPNGAVKMDFSDRLEFYTRQLEAKNLTPLSPSQSHLQTSGKNLWV